MPLQPGVHHISPTIPVHVFQAPTPGPTAIIQAGIHGDEIAGIHALEEMLEAGIRPTHGRLLVIPVMNPAAYRAGNRVAAGGLDLNRCFPGDQTSDAPELRLARQFMDLVIEEKPALVATLHESWKRYDPEVAATFGQTIVYGVEPRPPIVDRTIDRLNAKFIGEQEHFDPQHYPVATSSTEVIVEAVGCVGLCVETWMKFGLARRIEMQRSVVEYLLDDIGVRRLA